MKVSKNNVFLKYIARTHYKKQLLEEYNFKEGDWNSEEYDFNNRMIEKSKYYVNFIKKHQLDETNISDFNVFRPKKFIIRFFGKIFMYIIGFNILLTISIILLIKELLNQKRYVKQNIKSINYDKEIKDLNLTPFRYYKKIITSPISYLFNFFLGFIIERWGSAYFPFLFKCMVYPAIIFLQIIIINLVMGLSPLILLFFVVRALLEKISEHSETVKETKLYNFFNKKIEIK